MLMDMDQEMWMVCFKNKNQWKMAVLCMEMFMLVSNRVSYHPSHNVTLSWDSEKYDIIGWICLVISQWCFADILLHSIFENRINSGMCISGRWIEVSWLAKNGQVLFFEYANNTSANSQSDCDWVLYKHHLEFSIQQMINSNVSMSTEE